MVWDICHPFLVYADLMATADARNSKAAEMIYDKHLAELVRED
ncbi:MAG: type IV toxin-antitoxin system AbiEi family antitoxin [Desulfobacteraceae bacterium]